MDAIRQAVRDAMIAAGLRDEEWSCTECGAEASAENNLCAACDQAHAESLMCEQRDYQRYLDTQADQDDMGSARGFVRWMGGLR